MDLETFIREDNRLQAGNQFSSKIGYRKRRKMGKKNRRAIVLGIVSMVLFMIGDWLLDVKGSGN